MEYKTTDGVPRRVHKEYVDVVTRFSRDGQLEPVAVQWRDGRSFFVDEVLNAGEFGPKHRGRQVRCYRVRLGAHITDLYLESREAQPAMGVPATLRWWVYAYDAPQGKRAAGTS
ncbi:MAG: hypothetical protein ACOX1O_04605 [Eggerthellaceae bacterium]|jgi:hypothetical protein